MHAVLQTFTMIKSHGHMRVQSHSFQLQMAITNATGDYGTVQSKAKQGCLFTSVLDKGVALNCKASLRRYVAYSFFKA